ncbi:Protein shisa-5, partial [Galemys pyrenaicus]
HGEVCVASRGQNLFPQSCPDFCCGSCSDQYCCSDVLKKFVWTKESCAVPEASVTSEMESQELEQLGPALRFGMDSDPMSGFGATVAIGLTIFVLSVVTIIICFTCSCCCLYKMCRRPRRRKHAHAHPHPYPHPLCAGTGCWMAGGADRGPGRGSKLKGPDWSSFYSDCDHHYSHHRGACPLPTAPECATQLSWTNVPGLPSHAPPARDASSTLSNAVPATLPSSAHGPTGLPRDIGWRCGHALPCQPASLQPCLHGPAEGSPLNKLLRLWLPRHVCVNGYAGTVLFSPC